MRYGKLPTRREFRTLAQRLASVDSNWRVAEDLIPLLGEARKEALRVPFLEFQAIESPQEIDWPFLAASELFRNLINSTYKLIGGDSLVRVGHGIEEDEIFKDNLVSLMRETGELLERALGNHSAINGPEVMASYLRATEAHFRVAHACELFLRQGAKRYEKGGGDV